ncbi:hypothetical protein Pyn_01318 [Prunus yedoensis var. nudiflora]|uniref:Protein DETOXIFICATION 14-like n=1 Tax=Prunus yedoensis var. nudiflora TaxID=2094558 RepID=A0A314Y4X3_PRUYE|nr:hypothetical protein Pyn_01318 [Prunus yedoensis var. nudiflora]
MLQFGLVGALETLCGQAYGAEQYQKLGIYTYTSILCLCLTQSLILPRLYSSCAALCLHVPLCWGLTFKLKLGSIGAALAISFSYWFNVLLLGFYMKYSVACQKTRAHVLSIEVFLNIKEFFRFAVPSALMACLEWWIYEVLILLSGILSNPKLETSVLSICFTITYLHYFIPYAFGATASTRDSNELGAGNPQAAKVTVCAVMVLAMVEMIVVSTALFSYPHILGLAFSSDREIVERIADMAPLISLSIVTDGLQAELGTHQAEMYKRRTIGSGAEKGSWLIVMQVGCLNLIDRPRRLISSLPNRPLILYGNMQASIARERITNEVLARVEPVG